MGSEGTQNLQNTSGGQITAKRRLHTNNERKEDDRTHTIRFTNEDQAGFKETRTANVKVETVLPTVQNLNCSPRSVYLGDETNCTVATSPGSFQIAETIMRTNGSTITSTRGSTLAFSPTSAGNHQLQAEAIDERGNKSLASNSVEIEVASIPAPEVSCVAEQSSIEQEDPNGVRVATSGAAKVA